VFVGVFKVVSAYGFIPEDQMCEYHSMEGLVMSNVGAVLGCEHCACSCRDVHSGFGMDVHFNDVGVKDVSKNSCYCLRKIYYCPYLKIIIV